LDPSALARLLPRIALLLGNIAVGLSILAPAGMLVQLAGDLSVGVQDAGLLVTYGAGVLCISSPVGAWLTSRIERRILLVTTLAIVAAGGIATVLAPNYATVLAVRLSMLVAAALYTPQAAATVAMIVPEKERAGAIAFVFLGWSLALAAGLPLITFITVHFGWRAVYAVLATLCIAVGLMLRAALPAGLQGQPLSLASFRTIARNTTLVLILLITLVSASGQFSLTIYLAPLIEKLAGAGPAVAALFFAIFGVTSLVGNIAATAIVPRFGMQVTFAIFLGLTIAGTALWAIGAGALTVMGIGVAVSGLGFLASNSMQQARLAITAPPLAGASIALNTSLLYVGQAIGSGIGGMLYARELYKGPGYASVGFMLVAAAVLALTWQRRPAGP
jgi:predicted MFS family arabinose efflux permease